MSVFAKFYRQMRMYIDQFSNFTFLLATILCSTMNYAFAMICLPDPIEDLKVSISGIIAGLVCLSLIFGRWRRFGIWYRIVGVALGTCNAFLIWCHVDCFLTVTM